MARLTIAVALAIAAMAMSACSDGKGVPSAQENEQLNSGEDLLNTAPAELENVGEQLPERS